jgi:hypothetical protein
VLPGATNRKCHGPTKPIEALTAERIRAFVEEQQEENLHLDFKLVNDARLSKPDDRKTLAKAVSGFANADGGIIVWGVHAKENKDDIDCASRLVPISPLSALIPKLNEHSGSAVNPIVDGVLHRAFPDVGDSGFAATLVPASDGGPHMAKNGEDRYFKRTGDRFAKTEHFEIQDMFGRRKRPQLHLRCTVLERSPNPSEKKIRVSIENRGRVSAVVPYLVIKVHRPHKVDQYGLDGNGAVGLERLMRTGDDWQYFGGTMDTVIYQGVTRPVTLAVADTTNESDLNLEFQLAAEGVQTITGTLQILYREFFKPGMKRSRHSVFGQPAVMVVGHFLACPVSANYHPGSPLCRCPWHR